jgi:uncharacterized protein (TIGR03435 family)
MFRFISLLALIVALSHAASFEVSSVKANHSRDGHSSTNVNSDADAVKLTMTNVNLSHCIQKAYGVRAYQIEGPDWLKSEAFDIVGTVPSRVPNSELWPMLQTLLADRFKLTLHRETRTLPVFELVVAKNGAKIQPVEPGGPSGTWQGNNELTAKKEPMSDFAAVLSRLLDRPVIDKTGLNGVYDFTMEYRREDSADTTGPSIFTSLQDKLGLKLEARKGPVEILVIDHAERVPSEN